MLYLKFDLPVGVVNYNSLGLLTSAPVPFAPNRLPAIKFNVEIKGFQTEDSFIAFELTSDEHVFSKKEQFTLMRNCGFKVVPTHTEPQMTSEHVFLARTISKYRTYKPTWYRFEDNTEFKTYRLTTVEAVSWKIDVKGMLNMVLTTPLGTVSVTDHRTVASYQVGCEIMIDDIGKVYPVMTQPIRDNIPTHCPKCSNVLKRYQLRPDLPLSYYCDIPICKQLVVDEDSTPASEAKEEEAVESASVFLGQDSAETTEQQDVEETVPSVVEEFEPKTAEQDEVLKSKTTLEQIRVINLETNIKPTDTPVKLVIVKSTEPADFIVTKTKASVTRASRALSKQTGIPLIPLNDLEEMLNG